jgi:hypothetical protein
LEEYVAGNLFHGRRRAGEHGMTSFTFLVMGRRLREQRTPVGDFDIESEAAKVTEMMMMMR